MEKLFTAIHDALSRGEDLVLASIIASSGSTPRGNGAKMAVFAGGSTLGTVGGGAVEYHSILLAKKALEERAAFAHGFNLAPNETADIGMICGGQVTVYFQFFSGSDPSALTLFRHITSLFGAQKNTWLVTEIADGGARRMGVYARDTGLLFADGIPEADILPLVRARGVLKKDEPSYYVEPLTQAGYVYVFGGGHVSQELAPVLAHVGFSVVVYEDREAFADPSLFPAAVRTVQGPFSDIGSKISITADDYVAIMTRGHQADFEVLSQALRTEACYVGVIGSRHKIATTFRRLIEAGIPEGELARIHTPIGLEIAAETPAEIAISIAAELILHRAKQAEARA
jgi:xanthine dehydrogenase accessory factor